MSNLFRRFVSEDEGQDLAEYALLLALIAVVCIAGVSTLGTALNNYYTGISGHFPAAS